MILRTFSLSCFFIVCFALGKVQAQVYTFKNFTQDDGLPQSYIYDLTQGKNGFLYIATGEGLAVYGGNRFKKFGKKDGLAENFIYSIFYDNKSNLWIGHFQSGVTALQNINNFVVLKSKEQVISKIISFDQDAKGRIFFASAPGGIYQSRNDSIVPFINENLSTINKMVVHGNYMYIATQNGLFQVDLTTKAPALKPIRETEGTNVTSFDWDEENNGLWVGTEAAGIYFFQLKGPEGELKLMQNIKNELNSSKLVVKDIKKIKQTIWVSLYGEGLRLIDLKENYKSERIRTINADNGLPSPFITKIFEDREGNVWLGSFGSGLFQFISARFEFFTKNNGLPFENIVSIASDGGKNIVLLSAKELCTFNTTINQTQTTIRIKDLLPDEAVLCSYYDQETKQLLIGTEKSGVLLAELSPVPRILKKVKTLEGMHVNYIFKDKKKKNYFICTSDGLLITDPAFNIKTSYDTNNGLPHNNLTGGFIDKSERLWLFSPETPLYYIEKDYVTLLKDIVGLNSFKFISAIQDSKGNTWFCTEGDGVYRYNGSKFIQYSSQDGLLSDFGYFITSDQQDNILVGHKNGISIKYHNKKEFKGLDKSKGLMIYEFNQNAAITDADNNFWMGSSKGLVKYDSKLDKVNTLPPALSLAGVELNGERLNMKDSIINFPYAEYALKINYIGISLTDPSAVSYRYKCEGIDKEWRTTKERTIDYPILDDGTYRFILFAENGDGFETAKPIRFTIVIDKPLWKKTWFYVVLGLGIIELFYLIYVFRTRALRRQNLILEKRVEAKTNELQKEKEHVEAANKLLEEKNNDILDSINYAQRIQKALLPKKEIIELYVNSFVYYKPRDIVSGDFYWYYIKNGLIYVAVVDCTGHGVPGAFMSIIGSTILDQVTSELHDPLPGEILNSLNFKVNRSLKQYESGSESHDGMDIVLCRLNPATRELYFAGARRPIYMIRDSKLSEIKGTIEPVGGHVFSMAKNFESHGMKYEKGDMIYLFSDGYVDQFGGPNNSKYLSKNFKTLLLNIAAKTLEEQKDIIDQEFEKWKGNMSQIDDILIWGIRL